MRGSPRYIAAHFIVPKLIADRGPLEVLGAMERNDTEFFSGVWMQAGFRFTPRFFATTRGPFRVGVLTFPMPREQTEAWLGAIVGRNDAPPWFRYFLWEKSIDIMTNGDTSVLGEWRGKTHVNHGLGPPMTGNLEDDVASFVAVSLRACGLK